MQDTQKWPIPEYEEGDEPHFLFIITLPYSGSTALVKILDTSYRAMLLKGRGEGQWLIPGLCEKDRWDSKKEINYPSVKAVWLKQFQKSKELTKNVDIVLEKSPPNMMRIKELASQFKSYSFLANNRDPYACCASRLYRKYSLSNMNEDERFLALHKSAEQWLERSQKVQDLVKELNIPMIAYEEFCQDPSSILPKLNSLPEGFINTINFDAEVQVKNYPPQKIINQNARQIANLNDEELELLTEVFSEKKELLAFFGYRIRV